LRIRCAERLLAAAALGIAAALAGCAGTPAKHPSKPASAAPRAAATRPSPGPPHAMGDKVVLAGTVQAVVFQYRQPAAPDPAAAGPSASPAFGGPAASASSVAPGGRTYGAADVQVCVNSKATRTVTVSWKTWALVYAAFTVVPASTTDSEQFTQPAFPFAERLVPAGRCVRGWITFPVPADQRPTMVEYQPHGYIADWTVPST
jgi:hypothetical protein